MRKLSAIAIIICTLNAYSQDFDYLMNKKQIDCSDISYNSGLYFKKFMEEGKIDSAKILLNYWESKCGIREPIFRARLLLALKNGEFNDSLLKPGTINHIFNYQNRMVIIEESNYYWYDNYKAYFGFVPPDQDFDRFTRELATSIKNNYKNESIEFLFTEFYSDNYDTLFTKIQTKKFPETNLSKEYYKTVENYLNVPEFHLSWITGIWIPTGDLRKIGYHPDLGIQTGVKHKKMNYDLVMSFKFLNSANYYYARRTKSDNSIELTDNFFGGYIGIDIGREVIFKNGHEIQLIGGLALDGFDALDEIKENNLKAESIVSYNINFGLGYRYYITNTFYLGLRAKYNIVDYTMNNVVDFTGNPITIQFVLGSVNNVIRNNNLKALKFKTRK